MTLRLAITFDLNPTQDVLNRETVNLALGTFITFILLEMLFFACEELLVAKISQSSIWLGGKSSSSSEKSRKSIPSGKQQVDRSIWLRIFKKILKSASRHYSGMMYSFLIQAYCVYRLYIGMWNKSFDGRINRYYWLGAVNFGFALLFIESRRARAAERALYQSRNKVAHNALETILAQLRSKCKKLRIVFEEITLQSSSSNSKQVSSMNQSQNNLTQKVSEAIALLAKHASELSERLAEQEKNQKNIESAFERKNFAIRTELKCLNEQVKILRRDSNNQMEQVASLERSNRALNLTRIESTMRIKLLEEQNEFSDREITTLNAELNNLKANYSSQNIRKRPEFLEIFDSLQCKTHQNHQLESKMKHMANKMEILESELNSECTICFEHVNADRKWTAFVPCGHRICQPCSETIASRGRSQNTCPTCRKRIQQYLVLEGIYEE